MVYVYLICNGVSLVMLILKQVQDEVQTLTRHAEFISASLTCTIVDPETSSGSRLQQVQDDVQNPYSSC